MEVHHRRVRGFLALHDLVALVIHNEVETVLQKGEVLAGISVGGYYDSLTLRLRGAGARCLGYVVKLLNLQTKVQTVISPVGHLLLTRGENKHATLALLYKALHDAKAGVGLSCSRTIGEHHAFTITVLAVLVALVKELRLGFQYIVLLLGQEVG